MLDTFRKTSRWLTWIIVIGIGGVFVFFMGSGNAIRPNTPSGSAVIELGDHRVEMIDYQRERARQEEQLSASLGEQFDSRRLASIVDAQTLNSLVSSAILADGALEIGLRASKREVQDVVRNTGGFRDAEGKFDQEAFKSYAQWEFGSQRNFVRLVSHDILRSKMLQLLYEQVRVSDVEARESALNRMQEVRLAYVTIAVDQLPRGEVLSDEDVQAYLDAHRAALSATYEERLDEFKEDDGVRANHILIAVARDAEESVVEDARSRAQAALDRVLAGESFAEVAKALSEDPGTSEQGGDLGFIVRGESAPELEAATLVAEVGVSDRLIRTDSGFHALEIVERIEGGTPPFEDLGLQLAREAATSAEARTRAEALAEELSSAIREGSTLSDAAAVHGVSLDQTVMVKRRPDGFIPGIGGSEEALSTAFALTLENPSSARIFDVGSNLVLLQVLEKPVVDEADLTDALEQEQGRLLVSKQRRTIDDWVNRKRDQLVASGQLLINADLVIGDNG